MCPLMRLLPLDVYHYSAFLPTPPVMHPKRRLSAALPLNKRITKLKYLLVPALSTQPLFFVFFLVCLSVPWSVGSSKAPTFRQHVVLKSSEIKQDVYVLEMVPELKSQASSKVYPPC